MPFNTRRRLSTFAAEPAPTYMPNRVNRKAVTFLGTALLALALVAPAIQVAHAKDALPTKLNKQQTALIEAVIRAYLLSKPEIIREAIVALQKQDAEVAAA